MSEEWAVYRAAYDEAPALTAAEIAASHARHYAALLSQEEPGTPGWQFVFGQLSAASTLAQVLASRSIVLPPKR